MKKSRYTAEQVTFALRQAQEYGFLVFAKVKFSWANEITHILDKNQVKFFKQQII